MTGYQQSPNTRHLATVLPGPMNSCSQQGVCVWGGGGGGGGGGKGVWGKLWGRVQEYLTLIRLESLPTKI